MKVYDKSPAQCESHFLPELSEAKADPWQATLVTSLSPCHPPHPQGWQSLGKGRLTQARKGEVTVPFQRWILDSQDASEDYLCVLTCCSDSSQ